MLKTAKDDHVRIDTVNIMAMNYGPYYDKQKVSMLEQAKKAITATETNIAALGLNAKIGITQMIGLNNDTDEIFHLDEAKALVDYIKNDPKVALLGMWSMARDNGGSAGSHIVEPDSSGIAQNTWDFAHIFHTFDKS